MGTRSLVQQVYLVRHGETEWTRSGQHTGMTDIPLTESGRRAATRLAPLLASQKFTVVLTSPLRRAKATCELAGLAECADVDRDLVEWDYGDYEGLTAPEIESRAPGWMVFSDGCPGGESPDQIRLRVDRVIARIRTIRGDAALFGHGHNFRVLAARWLGLPVAGGAHFLLDTATTSILGYYRGIPAIKRWNAALDT